MDYTVTIAESSGNLTKRQAIRYKDGSIHNKIDDTLSGDETARLVIRPIGYVVLDIHNEKSDDIDYKNYVVVDSDGHTWVTGSESFWKSFKGLWDELKDDEEPWDIEIYKSPSKNYKGKFFTTCSLVG